MLNASFVLAEDVQKTVDTQQSLATQNTEDIDQYFVDEQDQSELHGYLEYNQNQEQQEKEENAIQLDSPTGYHSVNLSKPKAIESKSFFKNSQNPIFSPVGSDLQAASKFSTQEYEISPISTSYSKNFGKFSFGTMYGSSLDSSAQMSYSTGLFARYEGKHLAFGTGFSKNTNYNYDGYSDKFYFAPELKLTKRLSLLDVIQTDVSQINKSNELVLRYTPRFRKYADDLQFEVGAGQSYYDDNYVKSSLRFATKFKL